MSIALPQHVAIIMDGNGRWAKKRLLPRIAGHQQGLESARAIIKACVAKKISYLTLFTFSSENWRRSDEEIGFIFKIFLQSLRTETKALDENKVKLKVVGYRESFSDELKAAIAEAEALTEHNTGLQLNIAFNYGGRWDILAATRELASKVAANALSPKDISLDHISQSLALSDCPDPDLLIRTSGEYRISNFLIWQLAYTELYFTDTYFPDFREAEFEKALAEYAQRQRRFGASETISSLKNPAVLDITPQQESA